MSHHVAVVIAFYQKEKGLLARAVRSVLEQAEVDCEVVVVDDESPVSAASELADIGAPADRPVRIIARRNGGCAVARNTGLDHVGPQTEFVAFLDSDDHWSSPYHLRNAVRALELGYDLYFADCQEEGEEASHFQGNDAEIVATFTPLGTDGPLRAAGSRFFSQTVGRSIISACGAVYRFHRFPDLRFPERLWNAQDRLFWLDLMDQGARVVCTTDIEVTVGRGVSIYRSAAWASNKRLTVLNSHITLRKMIEERYALDAVDRDANRAALRRLRRSYALCLMSMARRGTVPDLRLLAGHVRQDPLILIYLPTVVATRAGGSLSSRAAT